MKKYLLLLFSIAFFCSSDTSAQTVHRMLGASPFQDSLWVLDTNSFIIKRRLGPTPSSGGSITGITGIAKNPNSGTIYVIMKQSATSGRVLGKYNPLTAVCTVVGNMGDNFSSITFKNDSLFGATGDGATVPESLFSIDTATGAATLLAAMGAGADGEVICYDPSDNMFYHWSGNGTVVYEKLLSYPPYTATNIPIIGATNGETFGALNIGPGKFIVSNISSSFNRFYSNGAVSPQFGSNPDDLRGLVMISCPRNISGTLAYCVGDSTLLTASAAASYQWYYNGAALSGATAQTLYATMPGKYNCIVADACDTDSSAVGVTVIENSLPTVSLSGGTTYCAGGSVNLTGTGGGTSQWYLNGSPIAGATSSTYAASAPGVYNMTKTNLNGCVDSAAVGITVTELPSPTVAASSTFTTICAGDNITLTGGGAVSYVWSGGATDGVAFAPSATDTYTVTGTAANGCTDTDMITVTVNALPTVSYTLTGNDTICNGDSIILSGTGAVTYIWDNGVTDGIMFAPSDTTTYMVTGTDANGCMNMSMVMILVYPSPVVIASPGSPALCVGASTTLTGFGASTYSWSGGVTNGIPFSPTVTMSYTVTGTDANGCMATDDTTITVNPLPIVTAGASSSTICAGSTVTLTGGGASIYSWTGGATNGVPFAPASTATYTVIGTDGFGCTNTDMITVTVNTVNVGTSTAGTMITASATGATYQWINCAGNTPIAGATSQSYTATANGNYAVVVTQSGCTDTSSCVSITGIGIADYTMNTTLEIYPNPSNGSFFIKSAAEGKYIIVNELGQTVQAFELNSNNDHSIRINDLNTGMYFIIGYNNNQVVRQKVMITK